MSTVDPRLAGGEKAVRAATPRNRSWGALGLVLLACALWVLAGYGIASQLDVFRLISDNRVGAWDSRYEGGIWMLVVGAFLGAIMGFILSSSLRTVLPGGASFVAPTAIAFLGLAIGTGLFFPAWTGPQEVGSQLGFLGSAKVPWSTGAWIFYYLPYWLPCVMLLIAVVVLVFVVRLAGSTAGQLQRARAIIRSGIRVTGTVSEADRGSAGPNAVTTVTMTVTYRDANGTDRWVTKRRSFAAASVPRVGDTYTVFYDQQDPANQAKIVLFPGAVTPAQAAAGSWS